MKFGEILKQLRQDCNITRDELASKIGYTDDYVRKIEVGTKQPSIYVLSALSKIFNIDLIKYKKTLGDFQSISGYNDFQELREAIYNKNTEQIKNLCEKFQYSEDFIQGEPLQLIYYSKALVSCLLYKNYEESEKLCFKGLEVDIPNFNEEMISNTLFSNTSYSLLLLLTYLYLNLNINDKYSYIAQSLVNNFDTVVFSKNSPLKYHSRILKLVYTTSLNNLADMHFRNKNFEESLELCNKGISLCVKFDTNNNLDILYKLRMENLYCLGYIEDSKMNYLYLVTVCVLRERLKYLEDVNLQIEEKYPLIKECIKRF